jgi:RNA polymerase sigma-70 factor (ECF subfamily)
VIPQNLNIDEELVSLIMRGDEKAFTRFYEDFHPMVYGIALKITHSTFLSEEIVQEVFLKIWLRRAELHSIDNIPGYLFTVARNQVFKVLKEIAKNYKTILLEETADSNAFSHNQLENKIAEKENSLILQKSIDRLPSQQKQVYMLIKGAGYKREEAAEFLQLKPETIKFHLAQAMKNIRSYCALHLDLIAVFCLFILIPE